MLIVDRNVLRRLQELSGRLNDFVETSDSIYPVTQRHILEERISRTRRCEVLKSY